MEKGTLQDIWTAIQRRRKLYILFFLISAVPFFTVQKLTEKVIWEAEATVRIRKRTYVPVILSSFAGVAFRELELDPETESEYIKSREVLSEAAKKLGMVKEEAIPPEVISKLSGMIKTRYEERLGFIYVIARSKSPDEAVNVANAVAKSYVKISRIYIQRDVNQALLFLDEASKRLENEVARAYDELGDFSRDTGIVDLALQLRSTLQEYRDANTALAEIEERISSLEGILKLIEGGKFALFAEVLASEPTVAPLFEEYVGLKTRYFYLIENFTEEHPEVEAVKRRMDAIVESMIGRVRAELYRQRLIKDKTLETLQNIEKRLDIFPKEAANYYKLHDKIGLLGSLFRRYYSSLLDIELTGRLRIGAATIFREAFKARARGTKNMKIIALIAFVLGTVVALISVFITEALEIGYTDIEALQGETNLPILSIVPRAKEGMPIVVEEKPRSRASEAIRTLRTNVNLAMLGKEKMTIAVTSCIPSEGKSFIASNLAASYTHINKKVLLLDLNLRRPTTHRIFGFNRKGGVTDIVVGGITMNEALKTSKLAPALSVITTGPLPPSPADFLSSEEFAKFLEELKERFEIIIADCPPIIPVTDTIILAPKFDGIILAMQIQKVKRVQVHRTKELIENGGGKIVGVVLNEVSPEFIPQIVYYHYTYEPEKDKSIT